MKGNIFSLSREVVEALEEGMKSLLRRSLAKSILIIDRSGCVLSMAGNFASIKPKDLAVIAAAAFTSLKKMANRADSNELSISFHNSNLDRIYFTALNDRLIAAIFYDCETSGKTVREAAREFISSTRKMLAGKPHAQRDIQDLPSSIEKDMDKLFIAKEVEKQERKS